MDANRNNFFTKIAAKSEEPRAVILSKVKYDELAERVSKLKQGAKKQNNDYWLLDHYDTVEVGGLRKLIYPITEKNQQILYYVHTDELYDQLKAIHERTGHGGRDRMLAEAHSKFKNIGRFEICAFIKHCEICEKKRSNKRKGIVVKPLVFQHMNSRAQLDLIDLQSQADNEYKMIMVCQDHLTKFVHLRPLTSKRADEVAFNLLDIFTTFGAPCVLQSDNGREFCNSIIESLRTMWPELKIVHGKPRHSQSQGSVERANRDIEEMLFSWLAENKTNKWSQGLKFVQFRKNSSYHAGIKRTPIEAMFGEPAKVGLLSTAIPQELWNKINTEEEMVQALTEISTFFEKPAPEADAPTSSISTFLEKPAPEADAPTSSISTFLEKPAPEADAPTSSIPITDVALIGAFSIDNAESSVVTTADCETLLSSITAMEDNEVMTMVVESDGSVLTNDVCQLEAPTFVMNETEQLDKLASTIQLERKNAREALEQQAKRMKLNSDMKFPEADLGATVRIPVPDVDRCKTDARSVLARVMLKTDDGFYKLGTKNGILPQLYARSQFTVSENVFVREEDVPHETTTLRTAATNASIQSGISHGQGFIRCNCTQKCASNRCMCFKKKIKCNSKCHSGSSCCNK